MQPEGRVSIRGYRDLVRVGSGGFSMVYRAYQDAFDRVVAVKVLTVELVDEQAQRRFQRECRASGRLSNHPNIVTVLDSGFTDDGRPFITTEFMSNGSLADRLEDGRTYSVPEVLEVGVKMCSALAAVHAAGILHRDIKPPNILMSDYDEPALADFGISAITVGPEASIGTSSLTPLHVAPEVLEGHPTSTASDVYSLGSTLYTLLAGHAPFQQSDEDALMPLMRRVVSDPVPDIDGRDDIPPAVMDLLRYSMEKQPFSRYGTAVSFGEAIQATQAHLGYPVTPLRKPGTRPGDFVLPPPIATTGDPVPPAAVTPAPPVEAAPAPAPPASPPPSESAPVFPLAAPPESPPESPPGSPPESPPESPSTSPAAPASSSKKVLLAGLAVLVVLALIGAALALRGRNEPVSSASGASGSNGGAGGDGGGSGASQGPAPPNLRFDVEDHQLDTATPAEGGVLRAAIDAEAQSWNPATSRFFASTRLVAEAVFDPLTVVTDGVAKPYLATAVTPNATYDEWVIELPANVKFHDGSALDAAAVKANFDARLENDLMSRPLTPVSSVTVEGKRARVSLRQPWPAFPVALAGQSGLMAAPSFLKAADGDHPVGTGPFTFKSWDKGTKISVEKNPSYWMAGKPYLAGIDFSIIGTNDKRMEALASGQADLAYLTDPKVVDKASNDNAVLVSTDAMVASVILNTKKGATSDVRLRRALGLAVDADAINAGVFDGKAHVAGSPFPSSSPWARSETSRRAFDLDAAKALMTDLGYSPDKPLALTLLVGQSAVQLSVGKLLQEQWKAIGVEVTFDQGEDTVTPIVNGDYEAAMWTYDVPTDADEFYVWFHTDSTPGDFTYNLPRISDPNIDRAFEAGRRESDAGRRSDAYGTVEQELIDQAPALWLEYLPVALAASPRVVGWQPQTMGGVGRGGTPWATTIGFK